jgi:hypothetical protein
MPLDAMRAADAIEARLRADGSPERAAGEKRYLKSDLEFLGATVWQIRREVRAFAGERAEVFGQGESSRDGASHDEDGIVARDGAEHFGEVFLIDRFRDRLGAAGHRMKDDELADTVHPREQLRQQVGEQGLAVLRSERFRQYVPRAARLRDPGEVEVAQVAR